MIDLKNGRVKIADDLIIYPNYTFDSFKKTSFYTNQDGIRVIVPEKQQVIDDKKYRVMLFFRNNIIYMLSLVCCEEQYSEENEKERKKLHDQILENYGVIGKAEYMWGKVSSEYDTRSNCCSINFVFYDGK